MICWCIVDELSMNIDEIMLMNCSQSWWNVTEMLMNCWQNCNAILMNCWQNLNGKWNNADVLSIKCDWNVDELLAKLMKC